MFGIKGKMFFTLVLLLLLCNIKGYAHENDLLIVDSIVQNDTSQKKDVLKHKKEYKLYEGFVLFFENLLAYESVAIFVN